MARPRLAPLIVALTVIVASCASARASETFAPPSTSEVAKDYLEGVWLIGKPAEKGDCRQNWYDGATQIEFEFGKSGGRLLIYEPYDLFQQIQISKLELDGSRVSLYGQARNGTYMFFRSMRIVSPDRIELLVDDKPPSLASRCSAPDRSVNEGMSMAELSLLTPVVSGSVAFPQAVEGVSDKDICDGNGSAERSRNGIDQGSIQFELFGPVHYWVFGVQYAPQKHVQEFDLVRRVHRPGPKVLKLSMQKHDDKVRDGWDVLGASGERYELTVIDKGTRFEIPELAATFIRCDPATRGMHRWGQ